jgi:hypothetical protein
MRNEDIERLLSRSWVPRAYCCRYTRRCRVRSAVLFFWVPISSCSVMVCQAIRVVTCRSVRCNDKINTYPRYPTCPILGLSGDDRAKLLLLLRVKTPAASAAAATADAPESAS